MDYQIEITHFAITNIEINTNLGKPEDDFKLKASFQLSVGAPKDSTEPTALVRVSANIDDETGQLHVSCSGNTIVHFDPIPDDWRSAIVENCRDMIQDETLSHIQQILKTMNIPITLSQG